MMCVLPLFNSTIVDISSRVREGVFTCSYVSIFGSDSHASECHSGIMLLDESDYWVYLRSENFTLLSLVPLF
jgi:hypothetical protein